MRRRRLARGAPEPRRPREAKSPGAGGEGCGTVMAAPRQGLTRAPGPSPRPGPPRCALRRRTPAAPAPSRPLSTSFRTEAAARSLQSEPGAEPPSAGPAPRPRRAPAASPASPAPKVFSSKKGWKSSVVVRPSMAASGSSPSSSPVSASIGSSAGTAAKAETGLGHSLPGPETSPSHRPAWDTFRCGD